MNEDSKDPQAPKCPPCPFETAAAHLAYVSAAAEWRRAVEATAGARQREDAARDRLLAHTQRLGEVLYRQMPEAKEGRNVKRHVMVGGRLYLLHVNLSVRDGMFYHLEPVPLDVIG